MVKAVKAKNVDYSVVCARNARTRARKNVDRVGGALLFGLGVERGRRLCPSPR